MNNLSTFPTLFSDKCLLRIPVYQRGFSWQNQQLSDFWDDLKNLSEGHSHYTGMISLKKLSKEECTSWEEDQWILDNGYNAYHVVDGQQRITTFIILINSILEYAKKHNIDMIDSHSIDTIESTYIRQKNQSNVSYMFGYECDNPSFEYMRYRILEYDSSVSANCVR